MVMKKKTLKKKKSAKAQTTEPKVKVNIIYSRDQLITENSDAAREIFNQSRFGSFLDNGQVQLSLLESLYLLDKKRAVVLDGKKKKLSFDEFLRKARRREPNCWVRYQVFKDIRDRGYIVKTALKFGADFRVYDRGVKPGEDHARWVVYPVHETSGLTWYEFSAKNRVAHSTKKRLLVGAVDDEGDVTYWEIRWMRP